MPTLSDTRFLWVLSSYLSQKCRVLNITKHGTAGPGFFSFTFLHIARCKSRLHRGRCASFPSSFSFRTIKRQQKGDVLNLEVLFFSTLFLSSVHVNKKKHTHKPCHRLIFLSANPRRNKPWPICLLLPAPRPDIRFFSLLAVSFSSIGNLPCAIVFYAPYSP